MRHVCLLLVLSVAVLMLAGCKSAQKGVYPAPPPPVVVTPGR